MPRMRGKSTKRRSNATSQFGSSSSTMNRDNSFRTTNIFKQQKREIDSSAKSKERDSEDHSYKKLKDGGGLK